MQLKNHAERELGILCDKGPTLMSPYKDLIIAIVEKFEQQDYDIFSITSVPKELTYTIEKLIAQEPLTEIELPSPSNTVEVNGQLIHERCKDIYYDTDAGWIYKNAIGFVCDGVKMWNCVDGVRSALPIKKFPFTPKSFFIDVTLLKDDPHYPKFQITNLRDLIPAFTYYGVNNSILGKLTDNQTNQ